MGSAKRALGLELKFNEYIFVEKYRKKSDELRAKLQSEYPDRAAQIVVHAADANEVIRDLCAHRDWRSCRAVVFLDPFGSQVDWKTIEAIASTRAIDLWYLFPAGLSVHRQISSSGKVHDTHEEPLDRLFGTPSWRQAFIAENEAPPDLFGHAAERSAKTATPESVTRFMIERMNTVFAGGALDVWLPLGRGGAHWYSLMFACANPSKPASSLALKLARAVIRSKERGRAK